MELPNLSLIFRAVPEGLPIPGQHLCIESRPISTAHLSQGSIITKNLFSSLDPYMRLMLIPAGQKHYREPYKLNEPLTSYGIAEVIKSANSVYPVGSILKTRVPIQQYSLFDQEDIDDRNIEVLTPTLPLAAHLGPLGMPGLTAYAGLFEVGKPVSGETVFVSSAAGAVGQLVGQICKRKGLKVVGSVGSEEKLQLIRDLGFDDGFNYKTEDASEALPRLCPQGIDIYFDNVGGEQLESAIEHMRKNGRIVVCGMVSQYNTPADKRYGVKNLFQFVAQGLIMQGFVVGDKNFGPKWKKAHQEEVGRWLEKGEMQTFMSQADGIESAAEAFKGMLEGKNKGKSILKIWRDGNETNSRQEENFVFQDLRL